MNLSLLRIVVAYALLITGIVVWSAVLGWIFSIHGFKILSLCCLPLSLAAWGIALKENYKSPDKIYHS